MAGGSLNFFDALFYSQLAKLSSVSIHFFWSLHRLLSYLGVDFKVSMMEVDGKRYKLTIWVSICLWRILLIMTCPTLALTCHSIKGYGGSRALSHFNVKLLSGSTRCYLGWVIGRLATWKGWNVTQLLCSPSVGVPCHVVIVPYLTDKKAKVWFIV